MKAKTVIRGEGTRTTIATFEGESGFVVSLEDLPGAINRAWTNGQKAEFECSATGSSLSLELDADAFIVVRHQGRRDYYLDQDGGWQEPVYSHGSRIKPDALRIPVQLLTDLHE